MSEKKYKYKYIKKKEKKNCTGKETTNYVKSENAGRWALFEEEDLRIKKSH